MWLIPQRKASGPRPARIPVWPGSLRTAVLLQGQTLSFTDDVAVWGMFPNHVLVGPLGKRGRLCLCWSKFSGATWVAYTDVCNIPVTDHFTIEEFADNLEMSREWPTEELRLNWLEHELG